MSRSQKVAAIFGLGAGYAAMQVLGRRAGSTTQERSATLPGDDLVTLPQMVMDHGITIRRLPEEIWPWLAQMGWHLGGYYTPSWVDRMFFPENWPSLVQLDPQLVRDLRIGDVIPDGKPGTAYFRVAMVEPPRLLVLKSETHLPPGWRDKFGARITWTWTIRLSELSGTSTRVHLRVRGHMSPWWLTTLYVGGIVPADFVMSTGMLRGLKRRAERGAAPAPSGRTPLRQESYLSDPKQTDGAPEIEPLAKSALM